MGPKTIHFWGPAANLGIVIAAILDSKKPSDKISRNMALTLSLYSLAFMRFALRI